MPTKEYLVKLIDAVDEDFKHARGRFQAYFPLLSGGFFLALSNYVYLAYVRVGIPADTVLLAVTLVVIADSFAISLLLSYESSARLRRIYASAHFEQLRKTTPDPVLLVALVKIRVNLPKGVTLREFYDRSPFEFTTEKLTKRALEPLP